MNSICQNKLLAKTLGLLSAGAFVALTGLPGMAQSGVNSTRSDSAEREVYTVPNRESPADSAGSSTTDPTYGEPDNGTPGISRNETPSNDVNDVNGNSDSMNQVDQGPSVVPGEGEGRPGPSETPSGSPSVPGVSPADDPGMTNSDASSQQEAIYMAQSGPTVVPGEGEGRPGASETPSGSPSVPGTSRVDDPGRAQEDMMQNGSSVERDALNSPSTQDSGNNGPTVVPGEGRPGPSETPSSSPSVPGTSQVDDPGNNQDGMMQNNRMQNGTMRNGSGVERDALNSPSSQELNNRNIGPSVVPGETAPGASETPSGSPSVPGNSSVDDPGSAR